MSRGGQCLQRSTQHRVGMATGSCTPARKPTHIVPQGHEEGQLGADSSKGPGKAALLFSEYPTRELQYTTGTQGRGDFRIVAKAPLALEGCQARPQVSS